MLCRLTYLTLLVFFSLQADAAFDLSQSTWDEEAWEFCRGATAFEGTCFDPSEDTFTSPIYERKLKIDYPPNDAAYYCIFEWMTRLLLTEKIGVEVTSTEAVPSQQQGVSCDGTIADMCTCSCKS